VKEGHSGDSEPRYINRLLCTDGILDREHLAYPQLSESDQLFFREIRDAIHGVEMEMY